MGTGPDLTVGAALTPQPAPTVTSAMRAHTIVHLDASWLPVPDLLRCDHPGERASFRIVDGDVIVWVTGTAAEFDEFAVGIRAMAQLVRLGVPK